MNSASVPRRSVLSEGRHIPQQLIRFFLSHPITTQIVGMRSLQNLRDNLETARNFTPMPGEEMEKLVAQVSSLKVEDYVQYQHPQYRDGRGIVA